MLFIIYSKGYHYSQSSSQYYARLLTITIGTPEKTLNYLTFYNCTNEKEIFVHRP